MLSPFIFLFLFTLILLPWIHYFHHIVRLLSRYLHVQIHHTHFHSTKWMLVFKKDFCGVFFKIIGMKSTKHFYGRSTSRICSRLKPTEHFFFISDWGDLLQISYLLHTFWTLATPLQSDIYRDQASQFFALHSIQLNLRLPQRCFFRIHLQFSWLTYISLWIRWLVPCSIYTEWKNNNL